MRVKVLCHERFALRVFGILKASGSGSVSSGTDPRICINSLDLFSSGSKIQIPGSISHGTDPKHFRVRQSKFYGSNLGKHSS
jgi:hypothetical protein